MRKKSKANIHAHHFRGRKGRDTFFSGLGRNSRSLAESLEISIIFVTDLPEAAARRYAWAKFMGGGAEVDATGFGGGAEVEATCFDEDRNVKEDFVGLDTGTGILDRLLFFAPAVDSAIFAMFGDGCLSYSGGERLSSVIASHAT